MAKEHITTQLVKWQYNSNYYKVDILSPVEMLYQLKTNTIWLALILGNYL